MTGATENPAWGNDATELSAVRRALDALQLGGTTTRELLGVVAAVMHASNVAFAPAGSGEDHAVLSAERAAALVAAQLGVADVSPLLLTRTVTIMSEPLTIQLTPPQADNARAALCKAVYCLLFEWLVAQVNRSIGGEVGDEMRFIGLLDVFGFESFEVNSSIVLCCA